MFPYPFPVMQVKVRDAWIEHAEAHGEARREQRGVIKVSNWDVATRVSEIAFIALMSGKGILSQIPEPPIGQFMSPIRLDSGMFAAISSSPADERYNLGTKASLRVRQRFVRTASLHVLSIYDPPFVDFLGWASTASIENMQGEKGFIRVPMAQLRPIQQLIEVNTAGTQL
jgi:hypothetical protein